MGPLRGSTKQGYHLLPVKPVLSVADRLRVTGWGTALCSLWCCSADSTLAIGDVFLPGYITGLFEASVLCC